MVYVLSLSCRYKAVEAQTGDDFNVSAFPSSATIVAGESTSFRVTVSAFESSSPVLLNLSDVPDEVEYSFSPSSVKPNGSSALDLTVATSVPAGRYNLTIIASRNNTTRTTNVALVVATLTGQAVQTKTGTISFSWSKTLEESKTFPLSGVTVTVSAKADMSLTMPLSVDATSNATLVKSAKGTWIIVSMKSGSAQIVLTLTARAAIGSISQSTTETWTRSFSTPLGVSTEIVFPTFSIPAIDVTIGQVTVDLTPKVALVGLVSTNLTTTGPCLANKQMLTWESSGTKKTVLTTINEEKDVGVLLSSPILTITQLLPGTNIGATLKTILGTKNSFKLGSIQLPVQANIPLSGSPGSLVIAEYKLPTPASGSSSPSNPSNPSPFWAAPVSLYWMLIGAVSITTVATLTGWTLRKRRKLEARKPTTRLRKIEPREHDVQHALRSHDYSTGALCYIDEYPLDDSTKVLKCPHCGTLFHEECLHSVLELRHCCPRCRISLVA